MRRLETTFLSIMQRSINMFLRDLNSLLKSKFINCFFLLMIGTKIAVWLFESISQNQETEHVINVFSAGILLRTQNYFYLVHWIVFYFSHSCTNTVCC